MRRLAVILLILLVTSCATRDELGAKNKVIRHALDSSVQLFTERDGGTIRAGSGVLIGTDAASGRALVLTSAHLLAPETEQVVTALSPLRDTHLPARILDLDPQADLALVEVEGLTGTAVSMKETANLGDPVWVVAFPWGRERTVVSGVVSQVRAQRPESDGRAALGGQVRLIDASVSYGMSGGGIYSQQSGDLLGLVRGYRSAELSFPGVESGSLTLPVAGETTVISVPKIRCFLDRHAKPGCAQNTRD